MKALEKLMFEVYKNFKLIFRNWSSLILIVLAPLFLILIVGYSFSGDQLHDIKIGVIASDYTGLEDFAANVSSFATIVQYSSVNRCIGDMISEKAHLCLEIKGMLSSSAGEVPSGDVTFYYDNTKKKTSLLLISQLKDFFGLTSEKIALISTEQIFSNIQDMLDFINSQVTEVGQTKAEAEKIRDGLTERKYKLIAIRDEFEPRYIYLKELQQGFQERINIFSNDTDMMISSAENAKSAAEAIKSLNLVPENSTEFSMIDSSIANLQSSIDRMKSGRDSAYSQLEKINDSLNEIAYQLDSINQSLNDEISATDNYITLINQSIKRIDEITAESQQRMQNLSALSPELAKQISRPITQSFTELVKNVKDVQLAFPILLSTIIIFISIIFANIITALELGGKAYVRNILAPVNDLLFTSGIALTNFIIIMFQVAVLLLVTQARFKVDVLSRLGAMVPVIVVLILLFVFVGMALAYLSKNIQTSILISTFVALGFFLFSDTINALESMPVLAARIAAFNPVVMVNGMFRQIIFFDATLGQISSQFTLLCIYAAGLLVVLVIVSKIKNKMRLKDY